MVCGQEGQTKEGSHAFTEEFYRFECRGSSMGVAVACGSQTAQRSWLVVHGRGRVERRVARRCAHDFRVCGLPGFGQCPFGASGVQRPGGWPAANPAGPGKTPELGLDELVATAFETTPVGGSDRLAP